MILKIDYPMILQVGRGSLLTFRVTSGRQRSAPRKCLGKVEDLGFRA